MDTSKWMERENDKLNKLGLTRDQQLKVLRTASFNSSAPTTDDSLEILLDLVIDSAKLGSGIEIECIFRGVERSYGDNHDVIGNNGLKILYNNKDFQTVVSAMIGMPNYDGVNPYEYLKSVLKIK